LAQIEKETKLIVSPEDYDRIRERGVVLECREQLNVYYHDPSRLNEGLGYLRVRFEAGREPVLTLKIPVSWEGSVRRMVELEETLREVGPPLHPRPPRKIHVDNDLPSSMSGHFHNLDITRLQRLGWMRNLRCVVDMGSGEVELDRTRLPDGTLQFEVEIETPDDALQAALTQTVMEWAPSATPSRIGKFSRFLETLPPGGSQEPNQEGRCSPGPD
jgi:uncharacterized protein YjbK